MRFVASIVKKNKRGLPTMVKVRGTPDERSLVKELESEYGTQVNGVFFDDDESPKKARVDWVIDLNLGERNRDMGKLSTMLESALTEMSARELRKNLRKKGCEELRQTGSHLQMKCSPRCATCGPQCQTTIPMHNGDIKKGTLQGIKKSVQPCVGTID